MSEDKNDIDPAIEQMMSMWRELHPFAMWSKMMSGSEQQMSDGLFKLMTDEKVANAVGKEVQQARMAHKIWMDWVQRYLAAMNIPSRSDIEMLEERFGKLEDGIAGLQAELFQLRSAMTKTGVASEKEVGIQKPRRTRKPAKAKQKK
jgi:hypothetical protein